ncbi:hypothetical protein AAH446_07060 [Erwinia sp. P6884]|uniref:hypothetical protein n=1 Tax=Erwinia sp. P6884 TaxID=3141450 RepID=UPI003185645B
MMDSAQPVFFSDRYSNTGRAARENLVTAIATPASMAAFSLTTAFDPPVRRAMLKGCLAGIVDRG